MNDIAPKIRSDIQIIPTMHEGQAAALVKDSIGLIAEPIILKGRALELLGLINGKNSIQDIQVAMIRLLNGLFVSSEDVAKAVQGFDEALLLDSQRYQTEKRKLIDSYNRLPVRKAFLAGKAYPDSEAGLKQYLDMILKGDQGPSVENDMEIKALVAPHIEIDVARKGYRKAYSAISGLSPSRILVLGTGHSIQNAFFSLTEKDFETPLGTVQTDKKMVRLLKSEVPDAVASYDLDHKSEHSLEFQLIFLQYLFGSGFTLLPVLCGSFHDLIPSTSRASDVPVIQKFIQGLSDFLGEDKQSLVVGGVDLSHIGPKFGHRDHARSLLSEARDQDQKLLESVCSGDVEALWKEIKRSGDRFNVCGFSTLACLLEVIPEAKGEVLDYDFWEEEATQSAVSFASVVLG